MNSSRRQFMLVAAGASSIGVASTVMAQNVSMELVKDSDPIAVAIGYSSDATKTDAKKYPQYAANQKCSGCTLFGGKATDQSAVCPVFASKAVSANGWCSAWVKKV